MQPWHRATWTEVIDLATTTATHKPPAPGDETHCRHYLRPDKARYRLSSKQHKDGISPSTMLTNFAPEPGQIVGMQLPTLNDVKGHGYVRLGPYAYDQPAATAARAMEQLFPAQYEASVT
jgi:hypothetical protein